MNCPVCGAQNLPNAAFCSQCATNLQVPAHGMPPHGMPAHGMPPHGMPPHGGVPHTSGLAIAGFVLSFFCGLLGLILSIIGYNECKKSGGMIRGEGLAIAGIVISILSMIGFAAYRGAM